MISSLSVCLGCPLFLRFSLLRVAIVPRPGVRVPVKELSCSSAERARISVLRPYYGQHLTLPLWARAFFLKNPTPIAHQPSASISGDYENARANDARNMRAHPHSTSCPPHPTFSIQDHIHILIHAIRRSGLFRAH